MRISRFFAALVVALTTMLAVTSSGSAITHGQPDGSAHPYVGLMVALDDDGVAQWRCSGSLLSSTVFLTAGHCTEPPAAHIEIWFDAGPIERDPDYLEAVANDPDGIVSCNESPAFDGYPCEGDVGGDPHPNPDFCIGCGSGLPGFAIRDVGVVTLDDPVPTSVVGEYAELPEPGLVDELANKTRADFVGYGVQLQAKIPGNQLPQPPPFFRWTGDLIRMFAPSELVSQNFTHSDEFIRFSLNASQGSGGTCFGDSGGPDLLGGTDTVLGVNSYVTNVNCSGVGYSQRVDIPEVLRWITGFMNR
jgi:Trypsin